MPATPARTELCEVARRRGRLGLAIGALLAPALFAATVAVIRGQSAEGEKPRVLFPRNQCVLESGEFDVVCVMADAPSDREPVPELHVDGKAETWEPYKAPVLLCRLELEPGSHELVVGSERLQVHVRGDGEALEAPDAWPVYRSHQESTEGWEDYTTCHEVTKAEALTVVGAARQPEACYECHSAVDFEATHFHPREPLDACHMCHDLHGSSGPSLLNGEVKKLCAECHE